MIISSRQTACTLQALQSKTLFRPLLLDRTDIIALSKNIIIMECGVVTKSRLYLSSCSLNFVKTFRNYVKINIGKEILIVQKHRTIV